MDLEAKAGIQSYGTILGIMERSERRPQHGSENTLRRMLQTPSRRLTFKLEGPPEKKARPIESEVERGEKVAVREVDLLELEGRVRVKLVPYAVMMRQIGTDDALEKRVQAKLKEDKSSQVKTSSSEKKRPLPKLLHRRQDTEKQSQSESSEVQTLDATFVDDKGDSHPFRLRYRTVKVQGWLDTVPISYEPQLKRDGEDIGTLTMAYEDGEVVEIKTKLQKDDKSHDFALDDSRPLLRQFAEDTSNDKTANVDIIAHFIPKVNYKSYTIFTQNNVPKWDPFEAKYVPAPEKIISGVTVVFSPGSQPGEGTFTGISWNKPPGHGDITLEVDSYFALLDEMLSFIPAKPEGQIVST